MLIEFTFKSQNGIEYSVEITKRHVWIKVGNNGSWTAFVFVHPMSWSGAPRSYPDDLKLHIERYAANMAFL